MVLLTIVFQIYINTCETAYDIIPLYSYSTPRFSWKAVLKHTGVKLHYLTDDQLTLLLQNNMPGGRSKCMGNRHVNWGERHKLNEDMTKLYGWSMSQFLPTGDSLEIELTRQNERQFKKKNNF